MTSGDTVRLGIGISVAVLVVLLTLIVLWLWRDVRHTRRDLKANQRTLKAIAAEITAESQRQEDVARKLDPGDEGDDPDKRHLKGLPPMAPVIGFISATGGYVLSAAQEHPREAVALVAAATAGAGVLIWGATQPGHHYAPSAGSPPAAVTSAPTTIRPSPTVRHVPTRKTHSRPLRRPVAVPVIVPSLGQGPRQNPTAEPDVPVPTTSPPEPSAPAPTRTVPPPQPTMPRPSPTSIMPTKIAPPPTAVPTSRPPHPTASPTPKPAHCIIGVNLLGVRVCVAPTHPPASTGP